MPLSNLQSEILRDLAAHRDPESDIAGSLYLTRQGARFSGDIDIFTIAKSAWRGPPRPTSRPLPPPA